MQSIDMQLLYVKSSNCLYEVIVLFKYDIACRWVNMHANFKFAVAFYH